MAEALLQVRDLVLRYIVRQGEVRAVDGVTFALHSGESLGLVGESGCGKTSLALALLRVLPDNARLVGGQILLDGVDLAALPEESMRRYRWRRISMIFQAAMSSLSPVHRVGAQIGEVLLIHLRMSPQAAEERVADLLRLVDLEPEIAERYPHELSGGMKQRAIIALALACQPDVVIADEPTTALDVIVQDRVLRELQRLQRELGTGMIYISHDVGVVAEVSDRIGVMYAGKLIELADTAAVIRRARHPYTRALIAAFPRLRGPRQELASLEGEPPDLVNPPTGCRFHPRCMYATNVCREKEPPLEALAPGHLVACWHPQGEGDAL